MRPIEAILSAAILLALFSLVIPLPLSMRWMQYAVPIALLIAVVQVVVERPRWQMVPAHALTMTLFLMWLSPFAVPGGIHVNRLIAGVGIGLGVLALIVSVALPILLPVFNFPKPTGPHAIGTVTYHWVDTSRPEVFTADPNDHRELMAQAWYPAKNEPSAPRAPYIQDANVVAPAMARVVQFPGFLFTHFKYVTTNAVASAPIADSQSTYMDVWMPADVVKSGLQQPNMFMTRDADTMRLERQRAGGWSEEEIALTLTTMRAVYESLPGDGYYLQMPKIFHLNFSDFPYWSPITSQLGLTGPIDGQRGFDIVSAYSVAFFDKHLNGQPSPLLDGPSEQYPEVIFEAPAVNSASGNEEERAWHLT